MSDLQVRATTASWAAAVALCLAASSAAVATEFRTVDGSGNNPGNAGWGAAGTSLLRLTGAAYEDGVDVPRGGDPSALPSPRAVSNAVAAQDTSVINSIGASAWLWQWGQFLSHDLSLTEQGAPAEALDIPVPWRDAWFDPTGTSTEMIGMDRSVYDPATGTSTATPRQQVNAITSYIDASNVYGSDATRAAALRTGVDGRLATSTGDTGETLLPFNTAGLPNAMSNSSDFFLAGDVRANEQVGLTATHTLFVREHNRIAGDVKLRLDAGDAALVVRRDAAIAGTGNGITDEDDFIYEWARKVVGAEVQIITYEEWLPLILGDGALDPFAGYDLSVDPGISNEFATAAFRVGHTMLSPQLLRIGDGGADLGSIELKDAFFRPGLVVSGGVDALLMGLASQQSQAVDTLLVDGVRNFLFGPPGSGGFDLASLNIQRGRDHGLAGLNQVRSDLGLSPYTSFLQLTGGDADLAAAFESVYASLDDVDLWVGGLAEVHVNGGVVGETFFTILKDQFTRLRDGDRFFYLNAFDPNAVELTEMLAIEPDLQGLRLSDIIRRNTSLAGIQDDVFVVEALFAAPEPAPMGLVAGAIVLLVLRRRGARRGRHPALAA